MPLLALTIEYAFQLDSGQRVLLIVYLMPALNDRSFFLTGLYFLRLTPKPCGGAAVRHGCRVRTHFCSRFETKWIMLPPHARLAYVRRLKHYDEGGRKFTLRQSVAHNGTIPVFLHTQEPFVGVVAIRGQHAICQSDFLSILICPLLFVCNSICSVFMSIAIFTFTKCTWAPSIAFPLISRVSNVRAGCSTECHGTHPLRKHHTREHMRILVI